MEHFTPETETLSKRLWTECWT